MKRIATILRPFGGPGGKQFAAGERVDTSNWRNYEALIAQRFIQPARLSSGLKDPNKKSESFEPVKKVKLKKRRLFDEVEA